MRALKIIIPILLVLLIAGGGVFGYFYLKTNYEIQIAEAEAELAALWDMYGGLGDIYEGYMVDADQRYGKQITYDDLMPVDVPSINAQNIITDIDEIVGKYYRVNVSEGTILTTDIIMDFPTSPDERAYDVITSYNPIGLKENDFVDIRINMPMGEDYIAIPHKRVEGVYGGVLKLVMSEMDIAIYNSLIVDAVLFQGATIYATKYIEPGSQFAAQAFYPLSASVLDIVMSNPNIAQTINYDKALEMRADLELAMAFLDENDFIKAILEAGKSAIPSKIQNGESAYQTWLAIEEQKRLEEAILASYGG
jgi:hypothetical protein